MGYSLQQFYGIPTLRYSESHRSHTEPQINKNLIRPNHTASARYRTDERALFIDVAKIFARGVHDVGDCQFWEQAVRGDLRVELHKNTLSQYSQRGLAHR